MEITAAVLLAVAALVLGVGLMVYSVRRNINDGDQIKGIVIEGAASFVEEITRESTQALVY